MRIPKYFYFRVRVINKGTGVEIEDASDADVEEVIRCKDCVFWGAKKDWIEPNRKCLQLDFDTASMFFCGFAERKRGKDDGEDNV